MNLFPEPAAQCKQPWQWRVQEMPSFPSTDPSYISGTGTPFFTALQTHLFFHRPALLSLLRQSIYSHRKRSLLLQLYHHEALNHLFVLHPRVSSHYLCCIVNRCPECKWCHRVCKTDPGQPRSVILLDWIQIHLVLDPMQSYTSLGRYLANIGRH